ncbi:hypothetical protein NUW54_g6859 [Trametes sanguinea]|uniref:Uncharacterized protein n=1 Tax=Trametes sanguinea TaxID=158606 RepID=A0ACC1PSQ7_9APHY|nr:hypothetical protein NUW54_g6859 [Trametes sanguinea]
MLGWAVLLGHTYRDGEDKKRFTLTRRPGSKYLNIVDATPLFPGPHVTVFANSAGLRKNLQMFAASSQHASTSQAMPITSSVPLTPTTSPQHLQSSHPRVDFAKLSFLFFLFTPSPSNSQSLASSAVMRLHSTQDHIPPVLRPSQVFMNLHSSSRHLRRRPGPHWLCLWSPRTP